MASANSSRDMWSNRWVFILASAGSAVGLGNLWKFPYITGENGGGAFVLIYLACIFMIGIPLLISEVLLGRESRRNPIFAFSHLAKIAKASRMWTSIGYMGALAGFLILSYYSVIAGWSLSYILRMFSGDFIGTDAAFSKQTFDAFLANPWLLLLFHSMFVAVTVYFVGRGVSRGLELLIRWAMPLLFVIIMVLLFYSISQGGFAAASEYMFSPQWDKINTTTVLIAMGHAFFSLSLGMAAMVAYGSYVPDTVKLGSTVTMIALLDTFVAIIAGLIIFSIVFANGLNPAEGPGLMFVTLPLAFGQMPAGSFFGGVFFILVSIAALTSIVSLMEPCLSWVVEKYNAKRSRVAITIGVIGWILGFGTVFSFNYISDFHLVGNLNFFASVDFISSNIMLPLGGLLIALFTSWVLPQQIVKNQLTLSPIMFQIWLWLARLVAPIAVFFILITNIGSPIEALFMLITDLLS